MVQKEIKPCSFKGCDCHYIENRTKWLCHKHNFLRLHPEGKKKQKKIGHSKKRKEVLNKDREFYRLCFETKPCICEECNCPLPNQFEDENGNIIAIWRFSHILSKASHPEFRHDVRNINMLCFEDHQRWEFKDKENMNIYESNLKIIEELKNEKNS